MAYSTVSAPSHKGFSITSIAVTLGKGIAGFFQSLSHAMVVNSTAQHRLEQVERLQALSDADLAACGLKREDIVHHVFRDLLWH